MTKAEHGGPEVDSEWVDLVADLATIQQRIRRAIYVPARALTEEEWRRIGIVRTILHEGQLTSTWRALPMSAPAGHAHAALEAFVDGQEHVLRTEGEDQIELFGTEFSLGKVCAYHEGARLANEPEVRRQLAAAPDDVTEIHFAFEPGSTNHLVYRFPDWEVSC